MHATDATTSSIRRPSSQPRPAPSSSLDAAAIVRQARRLRFRVKPGAVSLLAGAYHGARPGIGLTFAELRAYEPGDDVRHLDWNVTARQGRPYVRRFTEEPAKRRALVQDVAGRDGLGLVYVATRRDATAYAKELTEAGVRAEASALAIPLREGCPAAGSDEDRVSARGH